ncbi:regulator of MON1-CCZ1 complex protein bulli [Leptinotarsa decemlineata]|uniref:regulator of MON1-CCZ1 complex protein bulli n=1 Tax=Leptinotarsa decemlineata TaxID=7539 RepID=UPI003D304E9E
MNFPAAKETENPHYLELSETPVRFEAVNQKTNVFFDDSNKDVFAVRSGGVMGVVVKNAKEDVSPMDFRMEDHGSVLSIKFSLDHKILAVQRGNNSVEFMNFQNNTLETEYSQTCKKNSNILGFVWSYVNEVAFITDHGVELYMVIPDKRTLKQLKTTSATVQWFVWCALNGIALLASAHGSHLLPVIIKPGTISKLSKVETEPGRMALERDVTLATLYGVPAVLILRHQSGPTNAEVQVHTLSGAGQAPVKSHILKLGQAGRFAVNVVDDIILVHHQASRSTLLFDTALPGESDGNVKYHTPIAPARSLRPARLVIHGLMQPEIHICELCILFTECNNYLVLRKKVLALYFFFVFIKKKFVLFHFTILEKEKMIPVNFFGPDILSCPKVKRRGRLIKSAQFDTSSHSMNNTFSKLRYMIGLKNFVYSLLNISLTIQTFRFPNWVVFQPNIIIDAKLGCLWHIKLCLPELCSLITDLGVCTQVALNRTNGKGILLNLLLEIINRDKMPLDKIQEAFNHINNVYREWYEAELQSNIGSPPNAPTFLKNSKLPRVLINQDDIFNEIFQKLDIEKDLQKTEWLLVAYITSLSENNVPVQHNLNELLVTTLARQKKFTALQQLVQYGVISDSKPIACLLLSLGNLHPAASQMALDMLTRIGAFDEIQEILLSEGQILTALKIADNTANPRKFLSIAESSNDSNLFHSVLVHLRNNPHFTAAFQKDERLMNFVQQYSLIFNNE